MTTVKKRPPKKVVQALPLAERIAREESVTEEEVAVRGPLGNADYVEHGSPEHAAILGFDPDGTIMFDMSSAKPEDAERFVEQRKRYLEADGSFSVPESTLPMWDPDEELYVEEVTS